METKSKTLSQHVESIESQINHLCKAQRTALGWLERLALNQVAIHAEISQLEDYVKNGGHENVVPAEDVDRLAAEIANDMYNDKYNSSEMKRLEEREKELTGTILSVMESLAKFADIETIAETIKRCNFAVQKKN